MMSLNPLLLVGGVIGTVSVLLLIAYACVKDKKTAMGFERSMADGRDPAPPLRLRQNPTSGSSSSWAFLVLFSISYDIASPLIVGYIEELVVGDFELKKPLCQCGRIRGCAGLLDGQHLFAGCHFAACGPAHHLRFA